MGKLSVGLLTVVSLAGFVLFASFLIQSPTTSGQEAGQFQIVVEIDGLGTHEFKSVEGLDMETEVIDFREAGQPGVRKLSGRTTFASITLKRGFAENAKLWEWYKTIRDGELEPRNMVIILKDSQRREVLQYLLFRAWPCGWSGPRQVTSGVAIPDESICFTYEAVEREQP